MPPEVSSAFDDPLYRPRWVFPNETTHLSFADLDCVIHITDTDPGAAEAQWMADRQIVLAVTDNVEPNQLAEILPEFSAYAAAQADRPTEASINLPSRAVALARAARECGFAPRSTLAVADLRRPARPATQSPDLVRQARLDDVRAITELMWEQTRYEAAVGTLRTSPAIEAAIAAGVAGVLNGPGTALVTVRDGKVVAAVIAESADDSRWVTDRLSVDPVSYLAMASTTASRRGQGAGSTLVTELHARHRSVGVQASVLHYSAYNPLSVPFWSRHGYRPVITSHSRSFATV